MDKTYVVDGVEWLWSEGRWRRKADDVRLKAIYEAMDRNRHEMSKLTPAQTATRKDLLVHRIKLKESTPDPVLVYEACRFVLDAQGFQPWWEALSYSAPVLKDKIISSCLETETNVNKIIDWFLWVDALMGE